MDLLLVALSLVVAAVGAAFLSNATAGVGIIGGACLLAVLARMVQASHQHQEMRRLMEAATRALGDQLIPEWICTQCGTCAQDDERVCPTCRTSRPTP